MENKNHFTATHRLLHFIIAIGMLILYFTGLLRMKLVSKSAILSATEVALPDIELNNEQIRSISKTLREPFWQWHEICAYVVFFAIALRFIYMFVKGIKFTSPLKKGAELKQKLQGSLYLLFYVFTILEIISGVYLKWGSKDFKAEMVEIHKWGLYWFAIFCVIHIIGIIIGEFTNQKGIVSKMISGSK